MDCVYLKEVARVGRVCAALHAKYVNDCKASFMMLGSLYLFGSSVPRT